MMNILIGKTMMNLNNLESMMSHTIQGVLHNIGFTANEILQMIVMNFRRMYISTSLITLCIRGKYLVLFNFYK